MFYIYSWLHLVWLHMNFGHGNEKKVCSSVHQISVRTVHIPAVVQLYIELSKTPEKYGNQYSFSFNQFT